MSEMQVTFQKGKIVHDRYVIEDLLGRGGFGAVYRVKDRRTGGNVFALKEVVDPNGYERSRLVSECNILRRLDHPVLPRVYRIFEDKKYNRVYMLMDYIDGINLERLRQQQRAKCFSLLRVMTIMAPIMDAVAYLHAQHPPVIHRDIKPANIIVPLSGESHGVALVDFGIAKEYDQDSTTTAVRHCSPGYGAPEHYARGTHTRTDIYSLAATFYTLLTGNIPIDALYRMTQIGGGEPDPLLPANRLVPTIPTHIAEALHKAMAIHPQRRFASVEEFWQALNSFPFEKPIRVPSFYHSSLLASDVIINTPRPGELEYGEVDTETPSAPVLFNASSVSVHKVAHRRYLARRRLWLMVIAAVIAAMLVSGSLSLLVDSGVVPFEGHSQKPPLLVPDSRTRHTTLPALELTPTTKPAGPSLPESVLPVRPTHAPVIWSLPKLVNLYRGSIHNIPADVSAGLSLQHVVQQGKRIRGYLALGPELLGEGNFTGEVGRTDRITFLVASQGRLLPLYFRGKLNKDGSLSGTYCSYRIDHCDYAGGGYGTWQVFPTT